MADTTMVRSYPFGPIHALEIDPLYVDVAVRRWQAYTGKSAILAGSGETFETTAERRAKAAA